MNVDFETVLAAEKISECSIDNDVSDDEIDLLNEIVIQRVKE